ncbi:hypothetical protein ACXYTJ_15365 [Gilvimarinus sp. F26214L]|uniref:hypothetical protein n=1 Tax=Gilvimarinus sp. DZF01 TaxID=3461371 RepID=UPI0040454582
MRQVTAQEVDAALEDELYLQADKHLALCTVQAALDSGEQSLPSSVRSHYSLVMEEQARAARGSGGPNRPRAFPVPRRGSR